jgi:6-phosphogluconolactonase (cycloisomerase 2 family)
MSLRTLALLILVARPAAAGVLTFLQLQKDGTAGINGLGRATAVAVSPDGRNLYAASEGDDAVVVFSRNIGSGALLYAQTAKDGKNGVDGLNGAAGVAVAPDGLHVYVAGADDNAIAIFARNAATGALSYVGLVRDGAANADGLAGVRSVAVSPDGRHVYAAAYDDRALGVFARDPASGLLTFVEKKADGIGGVDGLAFPTAVVVSADGLNVYATGSGDDAVAVFARDGTTGGLTFVGRLKDGVNGVDGLAGASALALSPDDLSLYVAGADEDALAVFARNPATGALTFIEKQQNGAKTVNGMDVPLGVAVGPDGSYVFVAASSGRSICVFLRDRTTGRLTFLERDEDDDGSRGLAGVAALAPSPDGAFLYTAAPTANDVTVFQVTGGITTTTTPTTSTTSTTLPRCGTRPRAGCSKPVIGGAGLLLMKDRFPDRRDQLAWKWRRGAATSIADFGDPRHATGYRLCVFEPRGNGSRLILDAKALPGGRCGLRRCWARTRRGFRYDDPQLTPDGLRAIVLRSGPAGRAAITVAGKGKPLAMPRLPLTPRVVVQLRAGNGACWEADYGAPVENSVARFRARAD